MFDKQTITHLVLSGAGGSGFIYLGAIRYLQEKNYIKHIKHISGSSIGSLFAVLFALNISMGDFEEYLKEKVLKYESNKVNIFEIFTSYGFIDPSENYLFKIVREFLKKYNYHHLTFMEFGKITGIDIYIETVHMDTFKQFNFNINSTPNVLIIDAVFSSMSIPFIYKPYKIGNEFYIDGATINNIPINYFMNVNSDNVLIIQGQFNYNKNTDVNNFFNYLSNIINFSKNETPYKNMLMNKYKYYIYFKNNPIDQYPFKFEELNASTNIKPEDFELAVIEGYKEMYNFFKNLH
jgi:predicted acylesterase/phospholipase RssA